MNKRFIPFLLIVPICLITIVVQLTQKTQTINTKLSTIPTPLPLKNNHEKVTIYGINTATKSKSKLTEFDIGSIYETLLTLDEKNKVIYFTKDDGVYRHDVQTKKTDKIAYNKKHGTEFYSDYSTKTTALAFMDNFLARTYDLTEELGYNTTNPGYKEVLQLFSLEGKLKNTFPPTEPIMYGTIELEYIKSADEVIASSLGGDGCGGFGKIMLMKKTDIKIIQEIGGGCAPEPKYIGVLKNTDEIVLAAHDEYKEYENISSDIKTGLTKIYAKNIYTGSERTILNIASKDIQHIFISNSGEKIFTLSPEKFQAYNTKGKLLGEFEEPDLHKIEYPYGMKYANDDEITFASNDNGEWNIHNISTVRQSLHTTQLNDGRVNDIMLLGKFDNNFLVAERPKRAD